MISTRNRSEPKAPPVAADSTRRMFGVADLLLPASLALWVLGVSKTRVTEVGSFGLTTALPGFFYAGVALVIISAGIELARAAPSRWRMSGHTVALVVMLYGTAPLVYSQGRYAWLYKTVGVVQYVNAHGQLNHNIDIYQNWPGFFALAAWFGKVAGVASPLAYAKWAQLVFELAALPLLYLIYEALFLSIRQRWIALLLYSASNWIAQDYFSPQALGTLFSLGIMAIAIRWLYFGNSSGNRRAAQIFHADRVTQGTPWQTFWRVGRPAASCCAVVMLYSVLTFTHELSPYLLALQLGALAALRLVRPRWLPVALAAIAVGYLVPRFAFVNSHYGLLNSFGKFFSNAAPPSTHAGATPANERLIERSAEALSLGMWALALVGAWMRRRSRRTVLALVLLAFSPFILLGVQAYGDEGILRTYLFSLPWTAALAASALSPLPVALRKSGLHRAGVENTVSVRSGAKRGKLRAPVAIGVAAALFMPAFFGDDRFNTMTSTEVATVTSFLQRARPGPVYCATDNAPTADTARYNQFPLLAIFGKTGLVDSKSVPPDVANLIANEALRYTHDSQPAYILITPSMIAYSQAYGLTSSSNFRSLLTSLSRSRAWKPVAHRGSTAIYELPTNAKLPG